MVETSAAFLFCLSLNPARRRFPVGKEALVDLPRSLCGLVEEQSRRAGGRENVGRRSTGGVQELWRTAPMESSFSPASTTKMRASQKRKFYKTGDRVDWGFQMITGDFRASL